MEATSGYGFPLIISLARIDFHNVCQEKNHAERLYGIWKCSNAHNDTDLEAERLLVLEYATATTPYAFKIFQSAIEPGFYDRPLLYRACNFLGVPTIHSTETFRAILRQDSILRQKDISDLLDYGFSVLVCALRPFLFLFALFGDRDYKSLYFSKGGKKYQDWVQLLCELISMTDDLSYHHPSFAFQFGYYDHTTHGTTLWEYVNWSYGFIYTDELLSIESDEEPLLRAMSIWLETLYACNVDLVKYGEREHEIIFGGGKYYHDMNTEEIPRRWSGFTYGPRPEDWKLHLDFMVERFAGDFWDMIENPALHVPGAWVDDLEII